MQKKDFFTSQLRKELQNNTLSPLELMFLAQKECADRGFDFSNPNQVIGKLEEEVAEVREAYDDGHPRADLLQEIGDVFFSLVNLCRHLDVDPAEILQGNFDKFLQRCEFIENQLADSNKDWSDVTDPEIRTMWRAAKVTPEK